MESRNKWQDVLTAAIGIWVFIIPWVLAGPASATPVASGVVWSFHIVGLVIAAAGIAAVLTRRLWQEWVDVLLGAWLFASPWILHFTDVRALRWNALIMGAAVIVLAGSVLLTSGRRPIRHA